MGSSVKVGFRGYANAQVLHGINLFLALGIALAVGLTQCRRVDACRVGMRIRTNLM